jgi:hypothetical protein
MCPTPVAWMKLTTWTGLYETHQKRIALNCGQSSYLWFRFWVLDNWMRNGLFCHTENICLLYLEFASEFRLTVPVTI